MKGSTAETARKRPERPWTAARTMEVLRRCPLAIAQRLVHCAIALSTAVLDRVTKTMSVALLLTNNLDNSKQKTSNLLSPAPPPLLMLFWAKLRVQLHLPPLRSLDLAWNPVEAGKEDDYIYLSLHCHHQNDSCIKMSSNESHFNVLLLVRDKATMTVSTHTTTSVLKPEKGEPKRIPLRGPSAYQLNYR